MDWENIPQDLADYIGFVYKITNTVNNKKYIGKKLFLSKRKKKLSCRTNGKIVEKGKKKTVRLVVESDWKTYYGSSKELLADIELHGKESFKREIIQLAKTKGVLSYFELCWQLKEHAIWRDDYYNGIINVRLGRNIFPKNFDPNEI